MKLHGYDNLVNCIDDLIYIGFAFKNTPILPIFVISKI